MVDDIRYETDEGMAVITIDRPKVHNAFRRQTILELNETLREPPPTTASTSSS